MKWFLIPTAILFCSCVSMVTTVNHSMQFVPIAAGLPTSASSQLLVNGVSVDSSAYKVSKSFSVTRTVKKRFKDTSAALVDLNDELQKLRVEASADAIVNLKISLVTTDPSDLAWLNLLAGSSYSVVLGGGLVGYGAGLVLFPDSSPFAKNNGSRYVSDEQIQTGRNMTLLSAAVGAGLSAAACYFYEDDLAQKGGIGYTYRIEGDLVTLNH